MYFGTLVTQAQKDQDIATWKRDMDASRVDTPGRWRALWTALARLFG